MPADNFDYSRPGGENVELLQALIDDAESYTKETHSRNAEILKSIINNTEYTEPPQSEIEELLLELKAVIGGQIEVNELIADANGEYDAGLNKAFNPVTVAVPLGHKTITENGTYTASDDNLAGFDEVVVNVPTPENSYQLKSLPTGAISTITDGANLPMPSLKVSIEAVQSGSGDPSPTNIRPISGFSALNVTRCGKNFYDYSNSVDAGGGTRNLIINLPHNTDFVLSLDTTVQGMYIKGSNDGFVTQTDIKSAYGVSSTTFNSGNYKSCLISLYKNGGVGESDNIMLELGTTPSTYEAYSGTTYTTTLKDSQGNPMECYGGELSNVNGVQTLDNTYDELDLGTLNWTLNRRNIYDTGNTFYARPSLLKNSANAICSKYKQEKEAVSWEGLELNKFLVDSSHYLVICSVEEDAQTFKTAMDGVQLVYELATPQTIPQDNLAIASQDGTNNIWADSGNVLSGEYMEAL